MSEAGPSTGHAPQHHVRTGRGVELRLEEAFFEDEAQQVPIVPVDTKTYPAVSIFTPGGLEITSGVAKPIKPGLWSFSYFVPADAELSTDTSKWKARWVIYSATGRLADRETYFDVVDLAAPTPQERSFLHLCFEGTAERIILRRDHKPYSLTLKLIQYPGTDGTSLATASLADHTIEEDTVDQTHAFVYTTPPLSHGEYLVVWELRENRLSAPEQIVQKIVVPPMNFWFLEPGLRELIDRLMKKANRLGSYSTSTLYEYLVRGVDILNSYMPVTNFTLATFPIDGGTEHFLLEAAGAWALQAQSILTTEVDFAFQGQTVPIAVDRNAGYAAAFERMMADLNNRWPTTKLHLYRRSNPMGVLGVRQFTRRQQHQVVRLIDSSAGGASFTQLMGRLGLI